MKDMKTFGHITHVEHYLTGGVGSGKSVPLSFVHPPAGGAYRQVAFEEEPHHGCAPHTFRLGLHIDGVQAVAQVGHARVDGPVQTLRTGGDGTLGVVVKPVSVFMGLPPRHAVQT